LDIFFDYRHSIHDFIIDKLKLKGRIVEVIYWFSVIFISILIGKIIAFLWSKYVEITKKFSTYQPIELFKKNGISVYIEYEDYKNISYNNEQRKTYVVPVNTFFDTEIDGSILNTNSVQGKYFKKLYDSDNKSKKNLEKQISDKLKKIDHKEINNTKKGRKKEYPAGTIVEAKINDNNKFYLLALKEKPSEEDFVLSIVRIFKYYSNAKDTSPIYISFFDKKNAVTKYELRKKIAFFIYFLYLNKQFLRDDIHLIVFDRNIDITTIFNEEDFKN